MLKYIRTSFISNHHHLTLTIILTNLSDRRVMMMFCERKRSFIWMLRRVALSFFRVAAYPLVNCDSSDLWTVPFRRVTPAKSIQHYHSPRHSLSHTYYTGLHKIVLILCVPCRLIQQIIINSHAHELLQILSLVSFGK